MSEHKVFLMEFSKVFPLLMAKAEKKGRTKEEVYKVTTWLTGYSDDDLDRLLEESIPYDKFFENAPCLNPKRHLIKGSVCGVKLETIDDPLMREIRYLDKLIDELANGKSMDRILRDSK